MTCEHECVRGMLLRSTRGLPASHPLAKELLGFGRKHGPWLFGLTPGKANKLSWSAFKQALKAPQVRVVMAHPVLTLGHELSCLLDLDETDEAILQAVIAFDRLPRASELCDLLVDGGQSLPIMLGEAAGLDGHEAERAVRQHILVRLGFVGFKANWRGKVEMSLRWTFERLLDAQSDTAEAILELMVGPRQPVPLPLSAFEHVGDVDLLLRLLQGALREGAAGINILIHGPPGTGKTEFSRALANAAGARLHAVGEALDDGEEPDRFDRISAFQMGQRLLASSPNDTLLFDEMEDFIGDVQPGAGDWFRGREGSKVFVNRLVETNPVPVIWTTNAIGNVDPAILRRMSYVLKLDLPSRATALRMLERVAMEEGVTPCPAWASLIENAPETAAVLRVSARAARLAGEADGGILAAKSLVTALKGRELAPLKSGEIDLSLFESDRPIAPLVDAIRSSEYTDVSLLLTGPPGTGKTALAHHFARSLDRSLMVRRTSDLLSNGSARPRRTSPKPSPMRAAAEASYCSMRSILSCPIAVARASWEVSQVNELLTWLDHHPLPVIAATNFAQHLDPATARRFVFKLALKPLSGDRLKKAFERFFELPAPRSLHRIENLTPGDFALVARQVRHCPVASAQELVDRLEEESRAKPMAAQKIGF